MEWRQLQLITLWGWLVFRRGGGGRQEHPISKGPGFVVVMVIAVACAIIMTLISSCGAMRRAPSSPEGMEENRPRVQSPIGVRDLDRNVFIPQREDLMRLLRVAVVHNNSHIQFRYQYYTDNPSWYHQYAVFENGRWNRYDRAPVGPQPQGFSEDRISLMLDDGTVEGFAQYGGYVTSHPGIRSRSDAAPESQVEANPHIGGVLGEDEVNKFIPESREGPADGQAWQRVRPQRQLERLAEAGVFLDSWQWRAHRSNPLGYGDNAVILEYRTGATGVAPYSGNWDEAHERPAWMYDQERTGMAALRMEGLTVRAYSQDDFYYLAEDFAVPFDPDRQWQDGDAIPLYLLRRPTGSRGALVARGRWIEGLWKVAVTRTLRSPNLEDSKELVPGQAYHVAFAVHSDATGARWHRTSMPLILGVGVSGDIRSKGVDVELDDGVEVPFVEVPLFYPGQITYRELACPGYPLHSLYQRARENPLDPLMVEDFAVGVVEHELLMLEGLEGN